MSTEASAEDPASFIALTRSLSVDRLTFLKKKDMNVKRITKTTFEKELEKGNNNHKMCLYVWVGKR